MTAPTYRVEEPWILGIEGPNPDVAGVAVNSKGEVHALTRSPHPVLVFDQNGRFLRSWGEGVFSNTHGMHIAGDDTVFIVDSGDSTIRKFSPAGELLMTLGTPFETTETGYRDGDYRTIDRGGAPFNTPTGVAVAPNGELYVSDGYGNARVHRFTERGELIASWGGPGRGPGEFNIPHGVFVAPDGTVHIADRENNRVQQFTADGVYLGEWADTRRPDAVYLMPQGLAVVAELGDVAGIVAGMPEPDVNSRQSRVTIRDRDGRMIGLIGLDEGRDLSPCEPGRFLAAHGIWADGNGSVYVGEVINARRRTGPFAVAATCHALQVFRPT